MAENPLLSKLTVGSVTYDIKDAQARSDIADIRSAIEGGTHFIGITLTEIKDGDEAKAVTIVGKDTPVTPVAGDIIISKKDSEAIGLEFICANGHWFELGSTGALKALAFKDTAEGTISTIDSLTAADSEVTGTITSNVSVAAITGVKATFTGTEATIESDYTPSGSVTGTVGGTTTATVGDYTPAGTITGTINGSASVTMQAYEPEGEVSAPDITVTPETSEAISGATYTEGTETLELTSSSFMTSATAALDEAPTFTGTAKAPVQATGTTTATVVASDLTFAGTKRDGYTLTGSCETVVDGTAGKTLSFAGTPAKASATYTPEADDVTVGTITPVVTNGDVEFDLTAAAQSITPTRTDKTITVS